MAGKYQDHDEVIQALQDRVEQVAQDLAPDGRRMGADWRWGGSRGTSHSIRLSGPHRGRYMPFAEGAPHALGIIDAIAAILGLGEGAPGRIKAFDWARHQYGIGSAGADYVEPSPAQRRLDAEKRVAKAAESRKKELQKQERDRGHAHALFNRSQPLRGAQPYLSKGRGIYLPDASGVPTWPACVRYLGDCPLPVTSDGSGPVPTGPAIVVAIQGPWVTADGNLQHNAFMSVQRTYLDQADQKLKASFEMPKRGLGPTRGGSMQLSPAAEVINVCEGLENGLSLMMLLPSGSAVWAVPGTSFMHSLVLPALPLAGHVRVFADFDPLKTPKAGKPFRPGQMAAEGLRDKCLAEGRRVTIIYPDVEGEDWNDWLRTAPDQDQLDAALRWAIAQAESWDPVPAETLSQMPPPRERVATTSPQIQPGQADVATMGPHSVPFDAPDDDDSPAFPGINRAIAGKHHRDGTGYELKDQEVAGHIGKIQREYVYVLALSAFIEARSGLLVKKDTLNDYGKDQFPTGLGNILLASPQTAKVQALTFYPSAPKITWDTVKTQKLCFNTWNPSDVVPKRGNVDIFRRHLDLMFQGDKKAVETFTHWLASQVQHPGIKLQFAPLIISLEGTGKSWIGRLLRTILGRNNTVEIEATHLDSAFNEWARSTQFAVVEEMHQDHRQGNTMDKLKRMITSDTLMINPKGFALHEIPNRMNMMFLTNRQDAAVLSATDRRFWVWNNPMPPIGPDYMKQLWDWLTRGGAAEAVAWYLGQEVDLAGFNPQAQAPATPSKLALIEMGQDETTFELRQMTEENAEPFFRDVFTVAQILEAAHDRNRYTKVSAKGVSLFLRAYGAVNLGQHLNAISGARPRVWCHRRAELWRQAPAGALFKHMARTKLDQYGPDPLSEEESF